MDWWTTFYDQAFAETVLAKNDAVDVQIDFLTKALKLQPGARILDQCCGTGRLTNPLAALEYDAIGVDIIEAYTAQADDQKSGAEFHTADAFEFIAVPACDAVFNWHTSFGCADDDLRNVSMLRCAYNSLKPGGHFALDVPNVARVIACFRPHMQEQSQTPSGVCTIDRHSEIDLAQGRLKQVWTYTQESGESHSREGSTRLYLPNEIKRLLETVGFINIQLFGDIDCSEITLNSPRCIAVAQRE